MNNADEIVSEYIRYINQEQYAVPALSIQTSGDSTWIYLTGLVLHSEIKDYPPDFILNHPLGKVACYTGFRKSVSLTIDWFEVAKKEIGSKLCDDLHGKDIKNKDGSISIDMRCSFKYDPYQLKIVIFKNKVVKTVFSDRPFPY